MPRGGGVGGLSKAPSLATPLQPHLTPGKFEGGLGCPLSQTADVMSSPCKAQWGGGGGGVLGGRVRGVGGMGPHRSQHPWGVCCCLPLLQKGCARTLLLPALEYPASPQALMR